MDFTPHTLWMELRRPLDPLKGWPRGDIIGTMVMADKGSIGYHQIKTHTPNDLLGAVTADKILRTHRDIGTLQKHTPIGVYRNKGNVYFKRHSLWHWIIPPFVTKGHHFLGRITGADFLEWTEDVRQTIQTQSVAKIMANRTLSLEESMQWLFERETTERQEKAKF